MQNFLNNQGVEVSNFIVSEVQFLVGSFLLGVLITFIYDGLRIIRIAIVHNGIFVALEDLIFWVFTSISIFCLQYYQNDGAFRFFSIGGTMLGMLSYQKIISKFYVKQTSRLMQKMIVDIKKIINMLMFPMKKIYKWSSNRISKFVLKMKLIYKILKNRLTAIKKVIKVTLCTVKR